MPAVAAGAAAAGIAGGFSAGIATGSGFVLSSALIAGASSLVLGGLSRALAPKPKAADFSESGAGRTQSVRQAINPHQWIYGQAKVGGAITFAHSTAGPSGQEFGYMYLVHTFAAHECESIDSIFFNDLPSTDSRFSSVARVTEHLGAADQVADSDFVSEIPTHWTTDHRGRGRCYVASRLQFDNNAFPSGVPNIAAVIKGRKVYDPRNGTTAWSDNPALCVADYLVTAQSAGGWGMQWSEIDTASLSASATICEENIPILAGGTEERYTLNGVIDTSGDPYEQLESMLAAMAGSAIYTGGKWYIYAGASRDATLRLTDDDLRADMTVSSSRGRRDLYNTVTTTFVWPAASWQPTDAPAWTDAQYLLDDGDVPVARDMQLGFTVSASTAQRIAKIELERNRREMTVEFPAKLIGMACKVGDVVEVSSERLGWNAKEFVVGQWALAVDGGVDLTLFEHDSAIYAWNESEEQTLEIPGNVTLPGNGLIADVANLAVAIPDTSEYTMATLTWDPVQTAFLAGYDVEHKLTGSSTWTGSGRVSTEKIEIAVTAAEDFRVRPVTTGGTFAGWTTSTAPVDQTSFQAIGGAGFITVSWSGGLTCHIFTNTSDTLASATLLATEESAYIHGGLGTAETHYYWIRSVASDGNEGDIVGSVNATTDA